MLPRSQTDSHSADLDDDALYFPLSQRRVPANALRITRANRQTFMMDLIDGDEQSRRDLAYLMRRTAELIQSILNEATEHGVEPVDVLGWPAYRSCQLGPVWQRAL